LAVCSPEPTLCAGASRSIVVVGLGTATSFLPSDAAEFAVAGDVVFDATFIDVDAMLQACDES